MAEEIWVGSTFVSLATRSGHRDGTAFTLTSLEAKLLSHLFDNAGELVHQKQLLVEVWGYHPNVESRAVASTLRRLRAKIEPDASSPVHLVTAYGLGVALNGAREVEPRPVEDAAEEPPEEMLPARPVTRESTLVGRRDELELIRKSLRGPAWLVSVVGPGGIGKTALAEEVRRLEAGGAHWPGGLWSCALDDVADRQGLLEALVEALGVQATERGMDADIGSWLARRHAVLLILDSADRVTDMLVDLCERWRARAPELQLLVTSRERAGVAGEVVVTVGPLALAPAGASLAVRSGASAVALLRERVASSDPSHVFDDDELDALDAIARSLEGLPLALELVSHSCAVMGATNLVAHASDGGLDLRARRGRQQRHRTLEGTIAWSWQMLSEPEQRALARLSLVRHGVELACADRMLAGIDGLGPSWEVIERLVETSFLLRDPQLRPTRFRTFAVIRAFASRSRSDADTAEARRQLVLWWCSRLGKQDLTGRQQEVVEAFENALEAGMLAEARALLKGVWRTFLARGNRFRVVALANALHEKGGLVQDPVLAARTAAIRGNEVGLVAAHEEIMAIAEAHPGSGGVLVTLGSVRQSMGLHVEAEEALRAAIATGEDTVAAWRELGACLASTGRFDEAREAYARALEQLRALEHRPARADTLLALGALLLASGRIDEGRRCLREADGLAVSLGNKVLRAHILNNLAVVEAEQGGIREAIQLAAQAMSLREEYGDVFGQAVIEANLGEWLVEDGLLVEAGEHLDHAAGAFNRLGFARESAYTEIVLARLALAKERPEVARLRAVSGTAGLRQCDALPLLPYALVVLAEVYAALEQPDDARAALDEADSLFPTYGSPQLQERARAIRASVA